MSSRIYAHCPQCEELTNVTVEHESTVDDHFFDLRCNCGRRFYALPHEIVYANRPDQKEEKE